MPDGSCPWMADKHTILRVCPTSGAIKIHSSLNNAVFEIEQTVFDIPWAHCVATESGEATIDCLKPGGKLIIAVPSDDSFIRGAVNAYLNMPPHHASRWPDKTIKNIAPLFNINFIELHHEPLHKIHRRFYAKTKIYHFLNRLFRKK